MIHILCHIILNSIKINKEISVYINSIGGDLFEGLIVYNIVQLSKFDIKTICLKHASSISSLLLISGTIGKRLCLRQASLYMHQPNVAIVGNLTVLTEGLLNTNWISEDIIKIYMKHCCNDYFNVVKALIESIWISSDFAIKWTAIDHVV